ncbi:tropomyosin [Eurytemora carolleeae]|uniref:tropomyosin n=1 Tax=Eurytemora carolleeae TaxID=1294199 RepID=UPI000C78A890|nr:tropomyosin [Eurytemora carolleeae]|eukprot:XP_023340117.1 tropomyosin-like [Eurytemora affinis]
MDAIKKKMVSLSTETDTATARANKFDDEALAASKEADRIEDQLKNILKKIAAQESQFDVVTEDLFNASIKLEEKEKVAANAEADVGALSRRIFLMEDEADKRENRLATAISDLLRASIRADEQIKLKNQLELDISTNEEDIDELENQLKEARFILAESERKYEDISRKHTNLETENARATERADNEEKKISELEEELKVVGNNLQQLEVSEEKAMAREEAYQKQIRELMNRLKIAETQAENSEMNIQRLNIRIDQIEDDMIHEKLKIKAISDDLDGTFRSMTSV